MRFYTVESGVIKKSDNQSVLAIIPARGGSKGLPRKNIRLLNGKPLIAWTIEAALQSGVIDRCIVSTDDEEIAQTAKEWGADVPFLRPKHLASDEASGLDPVFHAIEMLPGYEHIVLLQPTSPLRSALDIQNAIKTYMNKSYKSFVSVTTAKHHPYHCFKMENNSKIIPLFMDQEGKRRQEMPSYYSLNGAIYIAQTAWLLRNRTFIGTDTHGFIMPIEKSIDIDTLGDFRIAEFLMQQNVWES
jgi:N-acylneuraminate cytidylyltransferase